jgi:hypothetical protein
VKVEHRSNNAIAAGLSSFQGTTHHQKLDVERHPEKAIPTDKKLRPRDRPLANDFVSDEEFDRLLHACFGNMARVLLPGRALSKGAVGGGKLSAGIAVQTGVEFKLLVRFYLLDFAVQAVLNEPPVGRVRKVRLP